MENFRNSPNFLSCVNYAKNNGIIIEMDGSVIKYRCGSETGIIIYFNNREWGEVLTYVYDQIEILIHKRKYADKLQRANNFYNSPDFLNLVEYAKQKNVIIETDGLSTIIKCESNISQSVTETEWRWNTDQPDLEEFILTCLKAKVDVYALEARANI